MLSKPAWQFLVVRCSCCSVSCLMKGAGPDCRPGEHQDVPPEPCPPQATRGGQLTHWAPNPSSHTHLPGVSSGVRGLPSWCCGPGNLSSLSSCYFLTWGPGFAAIGSGVSSDAVCLWPQACGGHLQYGGSPEDISSLACCPTAPLKHQLHTWFP